MEIFYYVHGTTYDNESKSASGWNNVELNELGKEQAINLGKNTPFEFDILFSSDLVRAVNTAELAFPQFKAVADSRLRECDYGDFNGKDKSLVKYNEHIEEPFPGGESLLDVESRMRSFLEFLKENYRDKRVGIIAHRAPQLALDVIINKVSWDEAIENDWRKSENWAPGWKYVL